MDIYRDLHRGFVKWMKTLGYASSTVSASDRYLNDFLVWLTDNESSYADYLNSKAITDYHKYLQKRIHKILGSGGLSNNYIISNINALKRFSRYLREHGRTPIDIDIIIEREHVKNRVVLTPKEIKLLYDSCSDDIYGVRDRAMLGIYYGCGLRKSEGLALETEDIKLRERLVYVRRGKGYKERYVPITDRVRDDLDIYMKTARRELVADRITEEKAFFISEQRRRINGNTLIQRIHKLTAKANIPKSFGLHVLRHTIATHLLQSGMSLEEVSNFLGHASLESTQIYTHIVSEMNPDI
jgi:integrase/recombinase XerD